MNVSQIIEAAYPGNLGFVEMVQFMRIAKDAERQRMNAYLKANNVGRAWALLKRVTGVALQDFNGKSKRVRGYHADDKKIN